MARQNYKQYQFTVIRDDLSTYEALDRIWASTPRNALNIFCTKRYGSKGFDIVPDKTIYGIHANTRDKFSNGDVVESVEIR